MMYEGFVILNIPNKQVETVGIANSLGSFPPGETTLVPVIVDAQGLPTVPPTPPVVRRILYFSFEYNGSLESTALLANYNWVNPQSVEFTLPEITNFIYSDIEEDYDAYKTRL